MRLKNVALNFKLKRFFKYLHVPTTHLLLDKNFCEINYASRFWNIGTKSGNIIQLSADEIFLFNCESDVNGWNLKSLSKLRG